MHHLIWFSPTGNVKYLAEKLRACLPGETALMELKKGRGKDLKSIDNLVVIFPVHGFNTPRTVMHFFRDFENHDPCKVWLIAVGCTLGWIDQEATLGLQRLLIKKGHGIQGDFRLAMPSTFIMEFPDEYSKELVRQAADSLPKLGHSIRGGYTPKPPVPIKSRILRFIGGAEKLGARFFGLELHVTKRCSSCGICWSNCPELNIRRGKKGRPRFGFSCLMCMKCIYECPEKAIKPYVSRFIVIKQGYHLGKYLS